MSCVTLDCIVDNCSAVSGANFIEFWDNNDCPMAYYTIINASSGATFGYNEESLISAQSYVQNLFNVYLETYNLTDDITDPKYNTFQDTLIDLCANASLPGICGTFLGGNGGYCSQFSRTQAINSQTLTDLCGCYVPPDENYLKYTLGSLGCEQGTGCTAGCTAGESGCTGQPACDPLCHRAMTSQRSYLPLGNLITCPQNICAINDVTINIIGSRVPGGINFNSVCSGCGGPQGADGCLCVVSGLNISSTLSDIGIGTNYKNFCSADSIAIITNEDGDILFETPLSEADPNPTNNINPYPLVINFGLVIVTGLILIVLILLITGYKGEKKSNSKSKKNLMNLR